jgi:hypothetical protein
MHLLLRIVINTAINTGGINRKNMSKEMKNRVVLSTEDEEIRVAVLRNLQTALPLSGR